MENIDNSIDNLKFSLSNIKIKKNSIYNNIKNIIEIIDEWKNKIKKYTYKKNILNEYLRISKLQKKYIELLLKI